MIVLTITVPLLFVATAGYVLANPDKAEKIAGWIWRGCARVHGAFDQKAVAFSVQGDVNTARAALAKNIPDGVIGGKLKVVWASPEEAQAHMRGGEVVVFMRRSRHQEENIANALMAYLPRAVVPRARRYVDRETMRAIDLTIAREILRFSDMPTGALDMFFEQHLDQALATESDLRERLEEVDAIDLHGWLTRVMLGEYRIMGDMLHPGQCDEVCLRDARGFRTWLGQLARREPYDYTIPLQYKGRYLRTGIIFVALRGKLETEGLTPYRRRAKRLIYQEKCDAVYLMARDDNILAVRDLRDDLTSDALVENVATYEYALRSDFAARRVHRERAIIVVLRRRRVAEELPVDDPDLADALAEEIEIFDPGSETATRAESVAAASHELPTNDAEHHRIEGQPATSNPRKHGASDA